MDKIYNGRKYKIFSRVKVPKKKGDYLYFIRIGEEPSRLYKIGTTNDILRRMKEHAKYYGEKIFILWVSPTYSKYTTLRVEDKMKKWWIEHTNWDYKENDRFTIPVEVTDVTITVRKDYNIQLE